MRAIVLAAGRGIRLRPLTHHIPKCLLEVNGTTILENCLTNLQAAGVKEVLIVVGHQKQAIIDKIGTFYNGLAVGYCYADKYETTNNIVSLQYAINDLYHQEKLDDLFLIESDVFFGPKVLPLLAGAASSYSCSAAVSRVKPGMNGTVVSVNDEGSISEFILSGTHHDRVFKTVNLYYLTKNFLKTLRPHLNAWVEAGWTNHYYEAVFADIIRLSEGFTARFIPYLIHDWAEVDDIEDLKRAKYQFSSTEQKYETVSKLHGYFWPYGLQDHCHLYNIYFPPDEMLEYFKSNLKNLITGYPSGSQEIAYYLSEWLKVDPEYLVIGNGASEIIKAIGNQSHGICVSTPSFNEFEECTAHTVKVPLDPETWAFDKEAFLKKLNEVGSPTGIYKPKLDGVIVTPNNPTSLAVDPEEIRYVLKRTERRVIVDESFLDFCDYPSMISELDKYPNLVILKSMGKVFGICGLRLGFMASADKKFVRRIQKLLPIWNINNFAETFLRQLNRYEKQFKQSCEFTKKARDDFYKGLCDLGLKAWKPDGNFVLCKMPGDGIEIAKKLFEQNILVKHCGGKTMENGQQYIRFGCRGMIENIDLCERLKGILHGNKC
jgi:histidinol-phosphate/aromatic aminotransferase/cobyric acid decarboxylase-like protein/choline kinase